MLEKCLWKEGQVLVGQTKVMQGDEVLKSSHHTQVFLTHQVFGTARHLSAGERPLSGAARHLSPLWPPALWESVVRGGGWREEGQWQHGSGHNEDEDMRRPV